LPGDTAMHEHTMNAADTLLERAAEPTIASSPAILTKARTVTYAQLDATACQYGHALRHLGVGVQDRVLILLDDRPEMFFVYLGAMKIGAVPVALNLRLSASDLDFTISDSDCKLVVVEPDYMELAHEGILNAGDAAPGLVLSGGALEDAQNLDELAASQSDTLQSVQLAPEDMAFWMYTSGTTGTSKAAVHLQKSLVDVGRYLGSVYGVGPEERIFCSSKLFFAFSLGHCLLGALRLGATTVLHTGWPSPEAIAETVDAFRPSVVLSVPTMYRRLLAEHYADGDGFKAVRCYISAGEQLPKRLYENWMAVTGRPILEGIGATEALVMFIANRPDSEFSGATGTVLPGTSLRFVSDDGEDIDGDGVPGVLWVHSDTLAAGYWKQEDQTAFAFKDGWYRTGDVFTRDADGRYFYQGRDDDMLKISGQWVSPGEIDELVLENPKVADAATVGISDEKGFTRLALCLVIADPAADRDELEAEISDNLTSNLSVYKCPRRFIYLDDMPKTATGKIQRFKLRQFASDQLLRST